MWGCSWRSSKALSKAKLAKQRSRSLVVCCRLIHDSFLNPSKTITSEKYAQQINETHQKLQRLQQALVNRKGPILHNIALCFKFEQIGLQSFASSAIFTWPLEANRLLLFQASQQLFAGKMLPQPAGGRKCFPRVRQISKHRLFTLQEKANLFLVGKNVLIVMVPILINKDVFEPS